jgi:hypothetical protein
LFVPVPALGAGEHRAGLEARLVPLCELILTPMHDSSRLDLEPVLLLFDQRLAYQASTDEAGITRIPDVAPGHYQLRIVLANGTILGAEIDVPAKRRAELTASLVPAG